MAMRVRVLDDFPAGHIRKRLGGIARGAGKTNARFAAIFREYLTEDIGTFADICGQRARGHYNGVGFVLLRFDQPLLARATLHSSLDKSLLFIRGQIAGRLPRGWGNPNRNRGSSKPSPINFFTSQSDVKHNAEW